MRKKSKIFIRLIGGLGNQLFIYAFGFAKSKDSGSELIIDNISGFSKRDIYRAVFCLDVFRLGHTYLSNSFLRFLIGNRYFWFLARILNFGYYEKTANSFDKNAKNSNLSFYQGYWQSYKYFDKYRDKIKRNLILDEAPGEHAKIYSKRIKESKNPVALCLRFYDTFKEDSEIYNVQDYSYYKKAIELMESKHHDLTFFIFSMNIKKAKKELSSYLDRDIIFVDPLLDFKDAYIDLHLMSLCNHFIISNGTMYWWAAYLGEKLETLVICPKNGFQKDMVLPNWIKV